ncbi:hydrogenase expression/formation protein HypE [Francisella frigiditurris]|uniref:Hydrogenase expression/formation protein HypE n=1 Tax=Francisella frigiditurris TaxID=1542390 RepID=A0A1J0KT55_9GAMM|nr:hydrogenase expression/formation protein HypE [Francisella frigiditurris]APC96937.1 hydrogenase expression/formation protein HypE [Francisella frigiditurris]
MAVKLNFKSGVVDLSMGSGGRSTHKLIEQLMKKYFDNEYLGQSEDQAILPQINGRVAMTTDSYVITPYIFPGGNIGELAVNGTINDLAVGGAKPLYISVGLILEEGLPLKDLKEIVISMAKAAENAGVFLVTGDTKVVEKGKGDGIFINTTGIGVVNENFVTREILAPGDKIIINGSIGDHGVAVMSKRPGLSFDCDVKSDTASLSDLIDSLYKNDCSIKAMRDPTRGGIGATLNEWADKYKIGINIQEELLPISEEVSSACELLGLDPLFIANEGKVLIACKSDQAERILNCLKKHPLGRQAQIIATVEEADSQVVMTTAFGGRRRVDWLSGEQLPRIC